MSETQPLGRDVFLALAAIGWADGELDSEEADAIVRTALEAGLDVEAIAEIEAATKSPIDIGVIDRKGMSKEDRLFVYAVASWMTRLDGLVTEEEEAALLRLGEALKVPERPRFHADAIAKEVAELSEDDRPARYDLHRLRAVIGERLHAAQAARAAQQAGAPGGDAEG
ncbi:MAG: TerB family tellurite resistance protein [Polyangiaceae bacterium]|nr:TerB family tellurite resistance protein [Polyangiaceae bacterium]